MNYAMVGCWKQMVAPGQESIVKASIISVSGMVTNADAGGMNDVTTVEQSGVSIIMQIAM